MSTTVLWQLHSVPINDLRYLQFSRMRTAWQTIDNIFSVISGGQAGVVNVR